MDKINNFEHSRRRSTKSKIGDALLTAGVILGVTGIAKSMKGSGGEEPPTEVKYCSECGTKNESDANFCAQCGHKFVQIDK